MSASASSHNDAASAPRQSSDSLDHTHGQSSASDDAAAPSGRSDRRMLSRSGRAGGVELGAAAAPATMKMKRVVSPLFLTASGIGSTIGAGIFVVTVSRDAWSECVLRVLVRYTASRSPPLYVCVCSHLFAVISLQ